MMPVISLTQAVVERLAGVDKRMVVAAPREDYDEAMRLLSGLPLYVVPMAERERRPT